MKDFNEWLQTREAQLILEQSGCEKHYLEQVWNISKVHALNSVMELVSQGVLVVSSTPPTS